MARKRLLPSQPLPGLTRVILVDVALCLVRLIALLCILSIAGSESFQSGFAYGATLLNVAIALAACLGAGMIATRRRPGLVLYWLGLIMSVLAVLFFAQQILAARIDFMFETVVKTFTLVVTAIMLAWYGLIACALLQAGRYFRLHDNPSRATPKDLTRRATYNGLCELSLSHNRRLRLRDFRLLRQGIYLERLDLSWTVINDEGVADLAALPRLRYLNLNGSQVSLNVLAILDRFAALESVSLEHTKCPRVAWARYEMNRWGRSLA